MLKLKTAIAVPSISDFYFTPHRGSFIGAHILQKILKQSLVESEIFILPMMSRKVKNIPLPKELSYLKQYIENEKLFFKNYTLFGIPHKKSAEIIMQTNPDIVFISSFAYGYSHDTLQLANEIRSLSKNVIITAGGAGVTVYPEYFIESSIFNHILTGDAETVIPSFLKDNFSVNTVYKKDFEFVITPVKKQNNCITYSTTLSRGCPKKCSFCSNHLTQGRKFRILDKDIFINAIYDLPRDEAVHIIFEDDNILYAKKDFFDLITYMKKYNNKITFSCENGLDFMLLDIEDIDFLIGNGITQFNFSIGMKRKNLLENNNREIDFSRFEKIVYHINKRELNIFVYFIAGLKDDDFNNIKELINYLSALPVILGISPFYPVPGIEGYEDKNIFKNVIPYLTLGSSFFQWNSITTEQLVQLFSTTRQINLDRKPILTNI